MIRISYGVQLLILIVWVGVVGMIFSLIADRQIAGAIAGCGFILIPIGLIMVEVAKPVRSVVNIVAPASFLILSSLPIFLLRVLNWGTEFRNLSLFGVSADSLHRISNILYVVMILPVAVSWYQERKLSREK